MSWQTTRDGQWSCYDTGVGLIVRPGFLQDYLTTTLPPVYLPGTAVVDGHIVPRKIAEDVRPLLVLNNARIAELEKENASLRTELKDAREDAQLWRKCLDDERALHEKIVQQSAKHGLSLAPAAASGQLGLTAPTEAGLSLVLAEQEPAAVERQPWRALLCAFLPFLDGWKWNRK